MVVSVRGSVKTGVRYSEKGGCWGLFGMRFRASLPTSCLRRVFRVFSDEKAIFWSSAGMLTYRKCSEVRGPSKRRVLVQAKRRLSLVFPKHTFNTVHARVIGGDHCQHRVLRWSCSLISPKLQCRRRGALAFHRKWPLDFLRGPVFRLHRCALCPHQDLAPTCEQLYHSTGILAESRLGALPRACHPSPGRDWEAPGAV